MNIKLMEIPIRDIVKGYTNDTIEGVTGLSGGLNIRPKYQREFIYKDKQRDAVVETVMKDFPLNVMYWIENKDGTFEVMDGQQRTISICEYITGSFTINYQYFHNLSEEEQKKILDYRLMVYFCEGTNQEKLDWFKTINIAGEKLTDQELRNAIYTGTWLSDAKRHFSRPNCPAFNIGSDYLKGSAIRQDYLETTIDWISGGNIEQYMADNQQKPNANELWLYFQSVINWVMAVFPNYRREMKGVSFGSLYNEYNLIEFDSGKLEEHIGTLMRDDDVTKKSGVYPYVITGNEKYLNIRSFTENQMRGVYERQEGICPICGEYFEIEEMEADHISPWHSGGKTTIENCQMICKGDNRAKSGK